MVCDFCCCPESVCSKSHVGDWPIKLYCELNIFYQQRKSLSGIAWRVGNNWYTQHRFKSRQPSSIAKSNENNSKSAHVLCLFACYIFVVCIYQQIPYPANTRRRGHSAMVERLTTSTAMHASRARTPRIMSGIFREIYFFLPSQRDQAITLMAA